MHIFTPMRSPRRARSSCTRAAVAATFLLGLSAAGPLAAKTLDAPPVTVDGARIGVPALERNATVFVPVRGVFEKLGAGVAYVPPASIVARKAGHDLVHMTIGSRSAVVRGTPQTLAVAPFESQGRVMVPLRLISEAAGAHVAYVTHPRTVRITHATVAAVAAPVVAAAAPAATTAADTDEHRGIPWWVWLLAALLLIGLLLALMRRKKEPVIVTSSRAGGGDPIIKTRR